VWADLLRHERFLLSRMIQLKLIQLILKVQGGPQSADVGFYKAAPGPRFWSLATAIIEKW
jgi:hypothetical protein